MSYHSNKIILAAILCMYFAVHVMSALDKFTAENVVKQHLDSIGTAASRAATKSRVFEGATRFSVVTGGVGTLDGKTVLVSEDRKLHLMMKFPNNNYHGEKLIYDGKKVQVAAGTDAQTRSNFGKFVYIQDVVLREGLLGGELSTAWPLLNLDYRKPKLVYEGLKLIDGRQLHEIQYKPQKGQDVEVHMYFDPETFHHVLTAYALSIRARLVEGGETAQAVGQQETRYRLEERFSDFKTVDGVTLPNQYRIHFTQEQQGGATSVLEWDTSATRIIENATLDPRNFDVK